MPTLGLYSPTLTYSRPAFFAVVANITKTLSDTLTISESNTRLTAKVRIKTETDTIGETIARVKALIRSLAAETTILSESINRIKGAVKTLSQTESIGDAIAKLITKVRALGYSHSTGEALSNLISKLRALAAQNTSISDAVDRTLGIAGAAIEKTLSETDLIAEVTMIRLKAAWRQQP